MGCHILPLLKKFRPRNLDYDAFPESSYGLASTNSVKVKDGMYETRYFRITQLWKHFITIRVQVSNLNEL